MYGIVLALFYGSSMVYNDTSRKGLGLRVDVDGKMIVYGS